MIVRSHLPWPLRWAVVALMLGFSARDRAVGLRVRQGHRRPATAAQARNWPRCASKSRSCAPSARRRSSIANTADSLLKAETRRRTGWRSSCDQIEAENLALNATTSDSSSACCRPAPRGPVRSAACRPRLTATGQLRFQLLVMQPRRGSAEFNGRYEVSLAGTLDGKPWTSMRCRRPEAPAVATVRAVEGLRRSSAGGRGKNGAVKVIDASGAVRRPTAETARSTTS